MSLTPGTRVQILTPIPGTNTRYTKREVEGRDIWWCESHKQSGDAVGCVGAHMVGTVCHMHQRVLLAKGTS